MISIFFLLTLFTPVHAADRPFEATFRDLMRVFDRDLRTRDLPIRSSVVLRRVETSGDLPASYREHLRAQLKETLVGAKVEVRPLRSETRRRELRFLDVSLYLDRQRLSLGVAIVDVETGTLLRQLNYDSEEWKAGTADFRLNQGEGPSQRVMQYAPSVLYGARFALVSLPDLQSRTGGMEIGIRGLERYSNRRYELGFDLSSVIGIGSETVTAYRGAVVQGVFLLGRAFIDDFEDYDRPRVVTYFGIGGSYSNGFLGSIFRSSTDIRLGKSFAVQVGVGYRPSATALLSANRGTVRGIEISLGVMAQFETYGRSH